MATFKATNRTCKLDFEGKVYHLPLHEDTADKIDRASQGIMKLSPKDKAEVDQAYNTALDFIDDILGEGAAEDVMGIFEKPGMLEAVEVVSFILETFKNDYQAEVEKMKRTAPVNREQRRARR